MVNKALLIGNLGQDPELRYTMSGTPVCNMRLATNERFYNAAGELQERTTWHRVVAFGKLAETCGEHLSKGRRVFVEGRIQSRSYEDQEGATRYITEIVAQSVKFLDNGNRSEIRSEAKEPETAEEIADTPPF